MKGLLHLWKKDSRTGKENEIHKYGREYIGSTMISNKKLAFLAGILFSAALVACASNPDSIPRITNSSPEHSGNSYAYITKINSINVTDLGIFSRDYVGDFERIIDFDKNGSMYILDVHECTISVYNENGKFIKSFGGKGQGPEEFDRPNTIRIKNDNILVFQGHNNFKLVDLDGKYLKSQIVGIGNYLKIGLISNGFLVLYGVPDQTFTNLDLVLKLEDDTFTRNEEIFKYSYPPGFGGPNYEFNFSKWLLISDEGSFYFPEDNFSKFALTSYDNLGIPLMTFERDYYVENYTSEAKDRFQSIYKEAVEKGSIEFPDSPPVIRKMFIDSRQNFWIVSGETYEDNRNPDFKNTFDIFSNNGKWLQNFKTNLISRNCFYNNGKIYNVTTINPETYEQFIDVYEIVYVDK